MRAIAFPIVTFSRTLSPTVGIVEPSVIVPNLGPLQGVNIDLTVTLAGATAAATSQSIDNVIAGLQAQDQFGGLLLDASGSTPTDQPASDLSVLNDILQPRGVRTAAPTITTVGGAGTATWSVFLPITAGAADMPAKINLTWALATALQNGGLVSAGTATVSLTITGLYSVGADQPTVRVKAQNIPSAVGDNSVQPFLPNGLQVEAIAWMLGADARFAYATLTAGGAFLLNQTPLSVFRNADTALMQSGHLTGEFIARIPAFVVDSTTTLNIRLASASPIRLYTIATTPQKRAA